MKRKKIAVLSGDGIGPEVMDEAIKVLDAICDKDSLSFDYVHADVGGYAYDKHGTALPKKTLDICKNSNAILFGSVGVPKWDKLSLDKSIERESILGLRKHFGFFANLRPAVLYPEMINSSPLKLSKVFDIMIVRELSGDVYFGQSRLEDEWASDEMKYTKEQCIRIARTAFEISMKRRKHVTCVDKSNVLSSSMLFRKYITADGDVIKIVFK